MSAARKRVLVVDDSPLMRRLISEIVESDPDLQVVDVAENGRVALEKVRQHQPDCVLLDIEMPELSGLDTMRRLHLRSPAKVVILSHLGLEGSRVRAQALRLGAADVIDKPTAAVSPNLRTTRGTIIQQTLRRVLGLPAVQLPERTLPAAGALTSASIASVNVQHFASLCERLEATALVELVNEHLAVVDEIARKHGGLVDAHSGGATLIAFGVPRQRADHATRAVAAGRELVEALAARSGERRAAGAAVVEVGVVIATGLVLAGELGPTGARRYRAMGSAYDVASRLGRASGEHGSELMVCGQTLSALSPQPAARRLDVVDVQVLDAGAEPVELYELVSPRAGLDAAALEAYGRGIELHDAGQLAGAIKAFDEVLQRYPADRAAARMRARCRALLAPHGSWRGSWPGDAAGRVPGSDDDDDGGAA